MKEFGPEMAKADEVDEGTGLILSSRWDVELTMRPIDNLLT